MVLSMRVLLLVVCSSASQQTGEVENATDSAARIGAAASKPTDQAADRSALPDPPDTLKKDGLEMLGRMLDQNWRHRPEWADMAAGILKGRAMGTGNGWFRPARKRHEWSWVSENVDANHDARVGLAEFLAIAPQREAWFARVGRDLSGDLTEGDFDWTGRLARGGNDPASTTADLLFDRADTDSNGRITRDEILEFFAEVDRDGVDFWTPEDLYAALRSPEPSATPPDDRPESRADDVQALLELLFTGQLGWFEPGPDLEEPAPDFTLITHDATDSVTLSDSFGKRPTVLVFGSFT